MAEAYNELKTRFHRLAVLGDAMEMLGWDQATMMPDGGADMRAEQLATLEVMSHELLVAPDVAWWLDEAEGAALEGWDVANLREMRRLQRHATAVPADLVAASSKANAACEMNWRRARAEDDFAGLLPSFEEVLRLTRETAAAKSAALEVEPYDALLDQYEPGMSAARVDEIFDDLEVFIPDLVGRAVEAQGTRPVPTLPAGPFPVEAQQALGRQFMAAIGFDFERGRLDVSHHPFCGGAGDDVRITTRYDDRDFTSALMGVLHETGHAMYEAGLPKDWRYQPVGRALGMAIHESQSLIVEMLACRSRAFVTHMAPVARAAFGGSGAAWESENLYRLLTRVDPGFIRVDADEVTYPAHVILRYRLERALIAGDLVLADLPGAWNDGLERLLGLTPPTDALGCLQDIHWPGGDFGYFPTYTLGAMTAAQLFDSATKADGEVLDGLATANFQPLMAWLGDNVHGKGSLLEADDLLVAATGRPLDPGVYAGHLEARYLA